jgi:hypothetical protein
MWRMGVWSDIGRERAVAVSAWGMLATQHETPTTHCAHVQAHNNACVRKVQGSVLEKDTESHQGG